MKKLALLVGSLMMVGAVAQAKEVVAAPVVIEESKEVIVAPIVIVEEAPVFRPNGWLKFEAKYYGETDRKDVAEYGRVHTEGLVNFTEQDTFEFRVRNYVGLESFGKQFDPNQVIGSDYTGTRLRYYRNHGTIGDTKVGFKSRIQYENSDGRGRATIVSPESPFTYGAGKNNQSVEYRAKLDVTEYVKLDTSLVSLYRLSVEPRYEYTWLQNNSAYDNQFGAQFLAGFELPLGLDLNLEIDAYQNWLGNGKLATNKKTGEKEDKYFQIDVLAELTRGFGLYQNGAFSTNLNFMVAVDTWTWKSKEVIYNDDQVQYSAFFEADLKNNYKYSDTLNLFAGVIARYENYTYTNESTAKDWSWQPQVYAGFKTTF